MLQFGMPTIRIDQEVFDGLKSLAEPFVDSPGTVIRRLLEEQGALAAAKPQAPPQKFEQQLLAILEGPFAGRGHKREVTLGVIEKMQAEGALTAADLELVATGETKAENAIAWARNALKERGHISRSTVRGVWELTPAGRAAAKQLGRKKSTRG